MGIFTIENIEYEDTGHYCCVAMASMITETATSNEAILTGKNNYDTFVGVYTVHILMHSHTFVG